MTLDVDQRNRLLTRSRATAIAPSEASSVNDSPSLPAIDPRLAPLAWITHPSIRRASPAKLRLIATTIRGFQPENAEILERMADKRERRGWRASWRRAEENRVRAQKAVWDDLEHRRRYSRRTGWTAGAFVAEVRR